MTSHERLGSELAGYRIESVIGRGGMSVVYLAEETHLERRVALKLLAPELSEDAKFRERFIRESRLAASLEHPNIITVYEAREVEGQLYIAMRYISGGDLKGLIGREGPLDAERTISILTQAASALDAAHAEGLIHRDVKPGNILLNPRSESMGADRVYLSDFGLTKRATSDSGITATGQFVGTLDYAAPEQFQGKTLDASTDVYSLGCVLYECLTGEVPYPQENQAALVYAHLMAAPPKVTAKRTDLPAPIDAVVERALAKSPQDRYGTASALIEAAAGALGVLTAAPTTPTRPLQSSRIGRRRSPAMLVGAGAAVLLAIGTVVTLVLVSRHGKAAGPSTGPPAALVDYVARVDPGSGTVLSKIRVGKDPADVAVGDGSVWIANYTDGTVSRVDPATGKATTIEVGDYPNMLAVGEDGVWVAVDGAVKRIDPASNDVGATVPLDFIPSDMALGESAVWLVDEVDRPQGRREILIRVRRIDPTTRTLSGPATLRLASGYCCFSPVITVSNGLVWVSSNAGILWRLDPVSLKVVDSRDLPRGIVDLAGQGESVWAAGEGTPGMVFRLNGRTGRVDESIPAGGTGDVPGRLAVDSKEVWVTDTANDNVSSFAIISLTVGAPLVVGSSPTAVAVGLGSVWVTVDGG